MKSMEITNILSVTSLLIPYYNNNNNHMIL